MERDKTRAKERYNIKGTYLGRRKITFKKGPLTVVGEAYQDDDFITVVTKKGTVRIAVRTVLFDDYAEPEEKNEQTF